MPAYCDLHINYQNDQSINLTYKLSPNLLILLATSDFERLERKRFLLNFDQGEVNGVLDGGHNTLAIGLHILEVAGLDSSGLKKIKLWSDHQNAWSENRDEIEKAKTGLDFLVPVEILVPSSNDESVIS